jgi:hypothetical protein
MADGSLAVHPPPGVACSQPQANIGWWMPSGFFPHRLRDLPAHHALHVLEGWGCIFLEWTLAIQYRVTVQI